ncbi:MAG TPA: metalloregulator ArsR/SmtB family transcription factor [Thermoanaerobaculia bacterium]|nr:metalloregulator ArsR/SmtB family transcription factor [Thermoanaerobaculia bacterium]
MRNQAVTYSEDAAFRAIADPTRRALLDLLRLQGSVAAGETALPFPISRPAVSKHLRVLRDAGLVRERREGRNRFYEVNPEPLEAINRWLESYRVFWNRKLKGLKSHVETRRRRQ